MTETGSGVVYDGVPAGRRARSASTTTARSCCGPDAAARLPRRHRPARRRLVPDRRPRHVAPRRPAARRGSGRRPDRHRRREVWPDRSRRCCARHPGVADVVVAGRPDDEWGQVVTAFVVPAPAGRRRWRTCGPWPRSAWPRTARRGRWCSSTTIPRTALGKPRRDAAVRTVRRPGHVRSASAVAGGVGRLAGVLDLDDVPPGVGPAAVEVGEAVDLGQLAAGQRLPFQRATVGIGRQRGDGPADERAGSRRWRSAATTVGRVAASSPR